MLSNEHVEILKKSLPFYAELPPEDRTLVNENAVCSEYKKGSQIYNSTEECLGLIVVAEGQIRAYITSKDGKEITLYRLLEGDCCIMSASCMIKNINFVVSFRAEKDSNLIVIPVNIFEKINRSNIGVKEFTLQMVSSRFSDVMWVLEQLVFSPMAKRLADFLLEQRALEQSDEINITHEYIANNLGTAREVVTRLLKYFQAEGIVHLSRGSIIIKNYDALKKIGASEDF